MENTTSQELQSLEAQLQAEFAGTQVAPTESNEIVKPEGIKEGNQEKVSNEKTDSDTQSDTDSSSDNERVSKLEEQRKRMLATKSKDEKEKELLRSEVEQYKTRLQEVDSIIKKYET